MFITGNNRGVLPDQYKDPAFSNDFYKVLEPDLIYIPIPNGVKTEFERGYNVFKEQPFYTDPISGFQVYPSINGFFKEETTLHFPVIGETRCAKITKIDSIITEFDEIEKRAPDGVTFDRAISLARQYGVICELDGRPLADKLEEFRNKGVTRIAVDAVEDEPYMSAQMALLLHRSDVVLKGLQLAAHILGVANTEIYTYTQDMDLKYTIPTQLESVPVYHLKGKYPVKFQFQKKLDEQEPTAVIGAAGLYHLYRAVCMEIPHNTVFISVSGNCLKTPRNMEVPVGMPIGTVLNICKIKHKPDLIVMGGSMTGLPIVNSDLPVEKAIRGVTALRNSKKTLFACMGCSRCMDVCPTHLMPFAFYRHHAAGTYERSREYQIDSCVECGACTYICPSKIDLLSMIRELKHNLNETKPILSDAVLPDDTNTQEGENHAL